MKTKKKIVSDKLAEKFVSYQASIIERAIDIIAGAAALIMVIHKNSKSYVINTFSLRITIEKKYDTVETDKSLE